MIEVGLVFSLGGAAANSQVREGLGQGARVGARVEHEHVDVAATVLVDHCHASGGCDGDLETLTSQHVGQRVRNGLFVLDN